eukprot:CAMPEP_0118921490 /NCGR_PEP_ID=MMETSP1169-20130426/750_1 /TAXON_ID=36882 /ORGANISM="Pyramimonas obovata, Strain CCMP722" /LENGTH=131 /DNA_ID=CAMNT_0006862217 /DNA_START=24 /DNA_END=415 /DNA_ORIENTATION=+
MADKAYKFAIDEAQKTLRQKEKLLTNLRREAAELVALTRTINCGGNPKEHKTCTQAITDFQGQVEEIDVKLTKGIEDQIAKSKMLQAQAIKDEEELRLRDKVEAEALKVRKAAEAEANKKAAEAEKLLKRR